MQYPLVPDNTRYYTVPSSPRDGDPVTVHLLGRSLHVAEDESPPALLTATPLILERKTRPHSQAAAFTPEMRALVPKQTNKRPLPPGQRRTDARV
jgi:hypothetical protein